MSTENDNPFYKSALVVAHPDDEILWFSSILSKVDIIIFCFLDYLPAPSLGTGRREVIAEYPLKNLRSLNITEAGSFNCASWAEPEPSEHGLTLKANKKTTTRYVENYHILCEQLAVHLTGCRNVYTHNPWGEYGHEDHVQVFRAISALQQRCGFTLRFSNYASNRSHNLMLKYISGYRSAYDAYPVNLELASMIADIYKKHHCWTWYDEYRWFSEELFMTTADIVTTDLGHGHIFPINYIKTDLPIPARNHSKGFMPGEIISKFAQRLIGTFRRYP